MKTIGFAAPSPRPDAGTANGSAVPGLVVPTEPSRESPPRVQLRSVARANDRHPIFAKDRVITVPRSPLLSDSDVVFTMGSCFAEEIRKALSARGQRCVPDYRTIQFDPEMALVDRIPDREHMNFYNTFTVRLQIEQMLGLWLQDPDDYWTIGRLSPKIVPWRDGPTFQDPYRRLLLARTPDLLRTLVAEVVAEMRRSFDAATAFVFTFGMTEVFVNRRSGKVAGQKPAYAGGGGTDETDRHDSTFAENLDNVRAIVALIRARKPDVPIVMSVSPVPLARTFGPLDVVTANLEGKSILRAVLGQVTREFDRVAYLPSYEYVTMLGIEGFKSDLRHVRDEVVGEIVNAFFDSFVSESRGSES